MNAVRVSDIQVMSLYDLAAAVAARIAARRRIGGFDHCGDSADMRMATARGVRVWFRVVRGARVSLAAAASF